MSDEPKAHGFSEFHQRHIRTTFQYIDKLLSEAEHSMADAGSPSLFRMHSDDTTPIQRKVTVRAYSGRSRCDTGALSSRRECHDPH
jgi:hypothetical protein